MTALRDYQEQGVQEIRDAYSLGVQRVLYQLPTGAGKTVLFCFIAANVAARGKRVLILVHRRELLTQASAKLTENGVAHGLIQAGFTPRAWERVQVASVQTLVNRLHRYQAPDYIVVDEAHHCAGKNTWGRILAAYPTARVLGVTATPCRLDGQGLGAHFDQLITGPSVQALTEAGHLAPSVVYAPGGIDTTGLDKARGDYVRGQVAARADKPKIVGDALAHYRRLAHQQPAIVFTVSVEAAEHFAAAARAQGYVAASVDGKMLPYERDRLIRDLGNGQLHLLCSCDLISEGVDVPRVEVGILLRPTMSLGLYMQQVGRILRPFPGKSHCTVLDHAGNTLRHGLPDALRRWTLTGGAEEDDEEQEPMLQVRQCQQCYHCHRPAPVCPACGYVYPIQAREVEQVEGELQRVDPAQLRSAWHKKRPEVASLHELEKLEKDLDCRPGWAINQWINQGHDLTHEELREHAQRVRILRGYHHGWVQHFLKFHGSKAKAGRAESRTAGEQA